MSVLQPPSGQIRSSPCSSDRTTGGMAEESGPDAPQRPSGLWAPPSLILCVSRVRRPERPVRHSPARSAYGKNAWHHTSTLIYVLMAWRWSMWQSSLPFPSFPHTKGQTCNDLFYFAGCAPQCAMTPLYISKVTLNKREIRTYLIG